MSTRYASLLLCFFLFCFYGPALSAQVPANPIGLNPSKLRWQQINTDKVQVVFPKGLEQQGQRVANLIHYLWERDNASIGQRSQKVSIFLQNQTTLPNGLVTVGPFRSEFYMTPPQFNCTTDWVDMLAIHEYRHVQQFGNSRQGLTQFARAIFGSWGWGGFTATALPRWFFEGDAVGMETALSKSGRGRLPSFEMEYRSLVLDDVKYSYEKAAAGSFKDFVPDWYPLGYYLTTFARRHYGKDIWQEVLSDAVRYRGLVFPFSQSLKKRTGLSTKMLYHNMWQELDSLWQTREKRQASHSSAKRYNQQKKKTISHYANPHYFDEEHILVEKRSYNELPAYYLIDQQGKEKRLTRPGILLQPPNSTLSVAGSTLCWAEFGFDPRWGNKNFSIIKTYDLNTGKKRKISSRSRYFSPALAPDGQRIVTVTISEALAYQLIILDAENGYVLQKIANPDNWFYSFPRWTPDQKRIVAIAQKGEHNQLQLIDLASGQIEALTPLTTTQLSHPYAQGNYVYFSAAYTGINNIFAVKIGEAGLFQVSDDRLGAFQPSVSADGQKLLYSSFSRNGFDIREQALNPNAWSVYQVEEDQSSAYYAPLVEQEGGSIFNKVPDEQFEVKKFHKASGLINPHSWLPYLDPPIAGLQILSDNKFSTLSASVGAYYNYNDEDWTMLANLSYAELYPIVNFGFRRANRAGNIFNFSLAPDSLLLTNFYQERWTENRFVGGLELPLNLSTGQFFNRIRLRADFQRREIEIEDHFDDVDNIRDTFSLSGQELTPYEGYAKAPISTGGFNNIDLQMTLISVQRRALQNLASRWGFRLYGRYRTILGSSLESSVLLARADLFLPGLMRNHSFRINGMYQEQELLDNYRFSDFFVYPRGYTGGLHDNITKFGVNYSFPIWYPDLSVTPLAFIKRIKGNLFYDQAKIKATAPFMIDEKMRSAGLELTMDFRALRLLEIDFGVRYSYLFDERYLPANNQRHQFEFLLISITE